MLHILLAILCVVPSAWVNVEAQIAINAGWSIIAAVVGFALLAPIFTMASARCFQRRERVAGTAWGAVAAVFMVMNMLIAISGISGVRDAAADIRTEQIRKEGERAAIRLQIAELQSEIGTTSVGVIEAEMALLKGVKWERANVRLEKAKKLERLEAQRAGWGAVVEVPSSVDPGSANIIALVVAIFGIQVDERLLRAILSGSFALLLEIGADLGPIAIAVLVRDPRPVQVHKPANEPAKPANLSTFKPANPPKLLTSNNPPNPPVQDAPFIEPANEPAKPAWAEALFHVGGATWHPTGHVYQAYLDWSAKRGKPPMSPTKFGREMGLLFPRKKKAGVWQYNVELKQGLRIVT